MMEGVNNSGDVNAGDTFADWDPGNVRREAANSVERMKAGGHAPSVTLRSDEGDTWTIGDGAHVVTGSNAALLSWLTRGRGAGMSSEAPLPVMPSWG